ncbi:MAG: glycoside hydrolase, partial [Pseudobdellovibrionaceae bacterium]|nr:glycoside hydrolase [Pseudobdellovibrionaceae bacterium]
MAKSLDRTPLLGFSFNGAVVTDADETRLSRNLVSAFYPPAAADHQFGQLKDGSIWFATNESGPGYLTYGPYTSDLPSGAGRAVFTLAVDNNTADDHAVARVDAVADEGRILLGQRVIHRRDFNSPVSPQDFSLDFLHTGVGRVEFRVYTFATSYLEHHNTRVTIDPEDKLDKLFNGNARLNLVGLSNFPTLENNSGDRYAGANLGTDFVALDGVWYLFNREYHWLDRSLVPGSCKHDVARLKVRYSTDRGASWSASEVVAEPNFGAGECAIVDADVYFDSETNTWHALA